MMEKTPKSMRVHIGLFGRTNVGKSTFLNLVAGQDVAIVSPQAGTTTDPVEKVMELLPIGPVVFTDTGGVDDASALGDKRREKMFAALRRMDVAVLVVEPEIWTDHEERLLRDAESAGRPAMIVVGKTDLRAPSAAFLERMRDARAARGRIGGFARERDRVVNAFKAALGQLAPESVCRCRTCSAARCRRAASSC
jgi:small GTP-binding protein